MTAAICQDAALTTAGGFPSLVSPPAVTLLAVRPTFACAPGAGQAITVGLIGVAVNAWRALSGLGPVHEDKEPSPTTPPTVSQFRFGGRQQPRGSATLNALKDAVARVRRSNTAPSGQASLLPTSFASPGEGASNGVLLPVQLPRSDRAVRCRLAGAFLME